MKNLRIPIVIFLLLLTQGISAQNIIEYRFNNTLAATNGQGPDLVPVCPGQFLTENTLLCNQNVYRFEENCGLQFNNTEAGNFIQDEYTIEMYFRFDELTSWKRILDFKNRTSDWGLYGFDGKVNFYNLVTSADAPFYTDKYAHILVTRTADTGEFIVYVDGLEYISFIDDEQNAVLNNDNILSFFYDDLVVADEVSSGEVFLIRLYDYVLTPDEVFSSFANVENQTVEVSICDGESYFAGGQEQTMTGTYVDSLLTAQGCDSIVVTNLQVLSARETTIQRQICTGDSFEGYTETGVYTDTIALDSGCDSIRVLELTVLDEIRTTVLQEICTGGSFEGYTESGMYTDTLLTASGCDSIRVLELTVLDEIRATVRQEICAGDSFDGYTESGMYTDTLRTAGGCDSIRLLDLTVLEVLHDTIQLEICAGTDYMGYQQSGTYIDTLLNNNGCQTIRTLQLTVLPPIETTDFAEICPGEEFNGYSAAGTYVDTFTAENGCDSIHTTTINVIGGSAAELMISNIVCGSDELGSVRIQLANANGNETFILNDSLQSDLPMFENLTVGTYHLSILSDQGCPQDATFSITTSRCELYIPNVFSPNGDGINDDFAVFAKNADNLLIKSYRIFDRWGGLVYEITDDGSSLQGGRWWDGSYRGEPAKDDLYIYQISIVADGVEEFYAGEILLVK